MDFNGNDNKRVNGFMIFTLIFFITTCFLFVFNIVIIGVVYNSMNEKIESIESRLENDENDNSNYENIEEDISYEVSSFKEITAHDISNESNGEIIVLWIGRQSCGYCALYAPVISKVADEFNIKARYIDFATIVDFSDYEAVISDAESFTILENLTGQGEWENFAKDNIVGTPLTLIIKDNQVIGGFSGYGEEETITQVFIDAGLSK